MEPRANTIHVCPNLIFSQLLPHTPSHSLHFPVLFHCDPCLTPLAYFPFILHPPLPSYLKSLYGWMIQTPADFSLSCSMATALWLPNMRRENLLTPGCSMAPNCLWMNVDWLE